MSDRYQGGIIRATPLEPSSSSASGIWTMEQQAKAEAAGNWPSPPPPPLQIDRSLRFNSSDSTYLSRTPGTAGNRKTWTWSGWVKRSTLTSLNYKAIFTAGTTLSDTGFFGIRFYEDRLDVTTGATQLRNTTQLFRDVSSWYHIVVSVDTTQATAANQVKIYVNGSQVTVFNVSNGLTQNTDTAVNNTVAHATGRTSWDSGDYFDGYMANIDFIDGQALTSADFGQTNATTGVWEPIAYAGTYGTNGFHLDFADNTSTTTLGYDTSGNGNNWTLNNFSVSPGSDNDSLVDTPTQYGTDTGVGGEVGGNYSTWNPLAKAYGAYASLYNGNLYATYSGYATALSTMSLSAGKWYCEMQVDSTGSTVCCGIVAEPNIEADSPQNSAYSVGYFTDGSKNVGGVNSSYGSTWSNGDKIGIAFDIDGGSVTFYKNGTSQGTISVTLAGQGTGKWVVFFSNSSSGSSFQVYGNFGQRPFVHAAPSGYKAMCATNLTEPDVVQGDTAFNTVLYTGNGSTQSITGVGFQPDFVWIKGRSFVSSHELHDVIRGAGVRLLSNSTAAESDVQTVTSFNSDGFTVAIGSGGQTGTNESSATFVGWNWKAGGSGVSNTDGSITSTVSANPTAGISIATYTGTGTNATVGHGLGVAPGMIIVKQRTSGYTYNWVVYHSANTSAPETEYLLLNTTGATVDLNTAWNDTAPTSTVFSIGTDNAVNQNTLNYVAYCFAPVEGFSAMGSYTGNGSTDGPFVYTGFRPAFVLTKQSSASGNSWIIQDNTRSPYNVANKYLYPDTTQTEQTAAAIDINSNGFKLRATHAEYNGSGSTYIYMAFAENPFKYALAR